MGENVGGRPAASAGNFRRMAYHFPTERRAERCEKRSGASSFARR